MIIIKGAKIEQKKWVVSGGITYENNQMRVVKLDIGTYIDDFA